MKRSPEELLEAYVAANHELVNALANIKMQVQFTLDTDGWRNTDQAKGRLEQILATASGKLELARETVR